MSTAVTEITSQLIPYAKPYPFNPGKPGARKRRRRLVVLLSSGLATLALALGLAYVDEMVGQNWLMIPLE